MVYQFTSKQVKVWKGIEKKSFKLVQIPLPNYLSTTKYMLKNQPNICYKIIMWNWQRKQEKKNEEKKKMKEKIMNTKKREQY